LSRVRGLLLLTGAVVFVDTLFYAALTPLLPHYAHTLHLGKTGAGVLAAAYPAGCLISAIPSGVVAARVGVKPTVLGGLIAVAACIGLFGVADQPWQLDAARFLQGLASSFTWTGALAWLVAGAPASRRGALIGQAFATAVAGALFGPVLGGAAAVLGTGWTFGVVALASLGLVAWAAVTPAVRPETPQSPAVLFHALTDVRIRTGGWLVILPALLFGVLAVLAPLRLSDLGYGSVAIGAVFLCSAAAEGANNVLVGRMSDRRGPMRPLLYGLAGSAVVAAALPWPTAGLVLAGLVVCGGVAFGTFFTPAMTLLANLSEERGLDYGYTFALVSLAWAPGQALGAAGGGALAHATSDALPYLLLAGLCALTLTWLWPSRHSTGWTTSSASSSSVSSQVTTDAG
jgi:MFS family permease